LGPKDFPTRLTSSDGGSVLSGRLKPGELPEPESTLASGRKKLSLARASFMFAAY
jgi:hypothetical protein